MDHPYFGTLTFYKSASPQSENFWQGELFDSMSGATIGITIEAGSDGPVQEQVNFIQDMLNHKDSIPKKIERVLKPKYEEWTGKLFPSDFFSEFELSGVTIPEFGKDTNRWDISFEIQSDQSHMFTVYFSDGIAKNVTVDG